MLQITLQELLPGIAGPMKDHPEVAARLSGLAEAILHGPSTLTQAEREVIATTCHLEMSVNFCCSTHAAKSHRMRGEGLADDILTDAAGGMIDNRLRALLVITDHIRTGGLQVSDTDVSNARQHGADDQSIHDTVLIAAAFCMFNRYVDGLRLWGSKDAEA